jgi:hypothetical protein
MVKILIHSTLISHLFYNETYYLINEIHLLFFANPLIYLIIFIDDYSEDKSVKIIENFQKIDERILLYYKTNLLVI